MNRDKFEGKWHEIKGKLKEKWGKLTDNDITQINGKYEQFLGSLQKRYGYKKEQAEREFSNWNWDSHSEGKTWDNHQLRSQLEREENKTWKENDRFHEGRSEDKNKGQPRLGENMGKQQDREHHKFGHDENRGIKDKNKQNRSDQNRRDEDYRDKKRKAG